MSRFKAVLLALAIGFGIVAAAVGIVWLVAGPIGDLRDEIPIFLILGIMVSIPFVVLALARVTERMPWIVGLVSTLALWGYLLLDAFVLAEPGSGANIGLGLFMLFSPLIISIICVAVAFRKPASSRSRDEAQP